MPRGHAPGIPAPPGLGPDDDLYRTLSRVLDGPSLKLYYDWGKEMRADPSRKDKWKKGDNINFNSWRDGARKTMIYTILTQRGMDSELAYKQAYGEDDVP